MSRIGLTVLRWRAPASGLFAVLLLLSMALGGAMSEDKNVDRTGLFAGPPPSIGAL